MDSETDTNSGSIIGPSDQPPMDSPEARWLAWALWSGISLVMAVFAVFVAGADTGLLLGWAVGVIVAAMLMVFGRK
jgi:hypothetical protein